MNKDRMVLGLPERYYVEDPLRTKCSSKVIKGFAIKEKRNENIEL